MNVGFLSLLAMGCVLGVKHAMEPDHVVAVTTITSKSRNLWSASLAGVFWGIGHTATLFLVGMVLLVTKKELPGNLAASLELCVGIMIVVLGASSLLSVRKRNWHQHERHMDGRAKTMLIGIVHGLAGSAALVLLAMSWMDHVWQGALFILAFGLGTVAGMLVASTLIGLPFVLTADNVSINRWLVGLTGALSILFGLYYMYEIGVNEGLLAL